MSDASTWVYVLGHSVAESAAGAILNELEEFMKSWSSHGRTVVGKARIDFSQILIVSAHVEGGTISGCGIDKSVHAVEKILDSHGVGLASSLSVCYIDSDDIAHVVTRDEFRRLHSLGAVTDTTRCVQATADDRQQYLVRLTDSWHSRLLDTASTS